MKALVYHGPRKVSVDNVDDAKIEHPNDAVVRITATNICGSDLHEHFDKRGDGWTKVVLHPNGS